MIPNNSKAIRLEISVRRGAKRRMRREVWEVSQEGYFRRTSPAATGWYDYRISKPRFLLEALEVELLRSVTTEKPPHWSSVPVLRSAVIAPTASRRSQVDVDEDSR